MNGQMPLFEPEDEPEDEQPSDDREYQPFVPSGKFAGKDATPTEWESGAAIEAENRGPLKQGSRGHQILMTFAHGYRQTAYTAGVTATGDYHHGRREARRLFDRGFLVKDGTLPNQAPGGRKAVDAYKITAVGQDELRRLA